MGKMVHFVDALVERGGQIEIAAQQLNFQGRIGFHGVGEVGHDIGALARGSGEYGLARLLVLEVPGPEGADTGFELFVGAEVELVTDVVGWMRTRRRS